MSTALTDQYAPDFCAADGTLLICASIHAKLELAAAIDPVKGCTVAPDPFIQHGVDRFMQHPGLSCGDRVRESQWMDLRNVQRLIRVDVTEPCNKSLVQ